MPTRFCLSALLSLALSCSAHGGAPLPPASAANVEPTPPDTASSSAQTARSNESTPLAQARQPQAERGARIAYLALNVTDAARSVDFYTRLLGMKERARSATAGAITEITLEFPHAAGAALIVRAAPGRRPVEQGNAYSRFALRVADIAGLTAALTNAKVNVLRPPARVEALKLSYALLRDPDGHLIELLQYDTPTNAAGETIPLPQLAFLSFTLTDVDRALGFYQRVLGLQKHGSFEVGNGTTELFMAFERGAAGDASMVLLSHADRRGPLQHGDALDRYAVEVDDLGAVLARLGQEQVEVVRPATRGTTSASFIDPDGYRVELIQRD